MNASCLPHSAAKPPLLSWQFLKHAAAVIYPPYVFSHRRGDIRGSTCAIHLYAGSWRQKPGRPRSLLSRIQETAIACTNEKTWGRISFQGMKAWYFLRGLLKLE